MNTTTRKEDNPNSSESVEASLEDFISQANATFPASDGWDLHTGDVELVDDEEGLEDAGPIVVKPAARKAETAAHLIKKADQSARSKKVTAAMLDDNGPTTVAPAPVRSSSKRNPFEVAVPIEDAEPAPLDPPPTGPRRRTERTEVVATARGVPWTANPMVWIAGVFAAFVAGAVLVFVMVRTMMPSQPVVVQAPPPVVVPAPAAAAQPVVTPLDKSAHAAAQPVVTPLDQPAARTPTPDEIPPPPVEKHASKHAAHHAAKAAPVREAKASAPAKAEPAHKAPAKAAAAASDDDDDDSAPATPAPKKAAKKSAAKAEKPAKGGDWVDPFAQ